MDEVFRKYFYPEEYTFLPSNNREKFQSWWYLRTLKFLPLSFLWTFKMREFYEPAYFYYYTPSAGTEERINDEIYRKVFFSEEEHRKWLTS